MCHLRWILAGPLQQVDEGVPVAAVEAEGLLLARHRDLVHVLRQLDLRLLVDGDELEDAA